MSKYIFNDLVSKSQEDLNRIKTSLDIVQLEDKYEFEKRKFRTENLRFIVIAIMTSFISLGSAYLIETFRQKNTADSDSKKAFYDLSKSYLLEKDISKQKEIACELANFKIKVPDELDKKKVDEYKNLCQNLSEIKQLSETISGVDISSTKTKNALKNINTLEKQISDLTQMKNSLPEANKAGIQREIKDLNNRINTLIEETPSIKTAIVSSEKIEKNLETVSAINKSIEEKTTSKSEIKWFKEGYFLQFGEFRVLLQYLDKNLGIQVEVCKTNSPDRCIKPILTKKWIKSNQPIQFTDDGKTYQINLEDINSAGKNPFKLAAYISLENID